MRRTYLEFTRCRRGYTRAVPPAGAYSNRTNVPVEIGVQRCPDRIRTGAKHRGAYIAREGIA
jgi:hypothetical protein